MASRQTRPASGSPISSTTGTAASTSSPQRALLPSCPHDEVDDVAVAGDERCGLSTEGRTWIGSGRSIQPRCRQHDATERGRQGSLSLPMGPYGRPRSLPTSSRGSRRVHPAPTPSPIRDRRGRNPAGHRRSPGWQRVVHAEPPRQHRSDHPGRVITEACRAIDFADPERPDPVGIAIGGDGNPWYAESLVDKVANLKLR